MYSLEITTENGQLLATADGEWWDIRGDGLEIRVRRDTSLPPLLRKLGYLEPYRFTAVSVR